MCSYMTNIHAQLVVKYLSDFWSKSPACLWLLVPTFDGNFHGWSVQTINYCPQSVYKVILIYRQFPFVY